MMCIQDLRAKIHALKQFLIFSVFRYVRGALQQVI